MALSAIFKLDSSIKTVLPRGPVKTSLIGPVLHRTKPKLNKLYLYWIISLSVLPNGPATASLINPVLPKEKPNYLIYVG